MKNLHDVVKLEKYIKVLAPEVHSELTKSVASIKKLFSSDFTNFFDSHQSEIAAAGGLLAFTKMGGSTLFAHISQLVLKSVPLVSSFGNPYVLAVMLPCFAAYNLAKTVNHTNKNTRIQKHTKIENSDLVKWKKGKITETLTVELYLNTLIYLLINKTIDNERHEVEVGETVEDRKTEDKQMIEGLKQNSRRYRLYYALSEFKTNTFAPMQGLYTRLFPKKDSKLKEAQIAVAQFLGYAVSKHFFDEKIEIVTLQMLQDKLENLKVENNRVTSNNENDSTIRALKEQINTIKDELQRGKDASSSAPDASPKSGGSYFTQSRKHRRSRHAVFRRTRTKARSHGVRRRSRVQTGRVRVRTTCRRQ
jgi:hypothetical protein